MSISITVDTTQWDRLSDKVRVSISEFIPKFLIEATPIVQTTMADNAPVRTGRLRASIYSEINETYSDTKTNTGYGLFADQPTKPHFIRPNAAKFLRFEINGQTIFAREVYHPGTPGSFFVQRTVDQVKGQIVSIAKSVWSGLMGA